MVTIARVTIWQTDSPAHSAETAATKRPKRRFTDTALARQANGRAVESRRVTHPIPPRHSPDHAHCVSVGRSGSVQEESRHSSCRNTHRNTAKRSRREDPEGGGRRTGRRRLAAASGSGYCADRDSAKGSVGFRACGSGGIAGSVGAGLPGGRSGAGDGIVERPLSAGTARSEANTLGVSPQGLSQHEGRRWGGDTNRGTADRRPCPATPGTGRDSCTAAASVGVAATNADPRPVAAGLRACHAALAIETGAATLPLHAGRPLPWSPHEPHDSGEPRPATDSEPDTRAACREALVCDASTDARHHTGTHVGPSPHVDIRAGSPARSATAGLCLDAAAIPPGPTIGRTSTRGGVTARRSAGTTDDPCDAPTHRVSRAGIHWLRAYSTSTLPVSHPSVIARCEVRVLVRFPLASLACSG